MILPELGFAAPPTWLADAVCSQSDPELFFPDRGGSPKRAKEICRGCDVREQCLAWALEAQSHAPLAGVWGASTEDERRRLLGRVTKNRAAA